MIFWWKKKTQIPPSEHDGDLAAPMSTMTVQEAFNACMNDPANKNLDMEQLSAAGSSLTITVPVEATLTHEQAKQAYVVWRLTK